MTIGIGGYWFSFSERADGRVDYDFHHGTRTFAHGSAPSRDDVIDLFDQIVACNMETEGNG